MKESFSELYTRLYNENIEELEVYRKKEKKSALIILIWFFSVFLSGVIVPFLMPILMLGGIVSFVIYVVKGLKSTKPKEKTYKDVFKERIITPLIENTLEGSKYEPKKGITELDYRRGGYNEHYDRYGSDDLVIAPVTNKQGDTTFITFSEVHTEVESTDSDGNTTYSTVFHGLASYFPMPKSINSELYIRFNGRVSRFNKDKVNMDMSQFEKLFDVECKDKILAMRILTSDIMTEMLDIYEKYKYRYEINIKNDMVYMRIMCGSLFEPSTFKSSMEYKQIEKYYLVLKALMDLFTHINNTINEIDI